MTEEEQELQTPWHQTVIFGLGILEENVNLWVWQECVANGDVQKLKLVLYAEFKILSALTHEVCVYCNATSMEEENSHCIICMCQSILMILFKKKVKKSPV